MVYSIVREQVSNVLKYANALNIIIELMLENDFIDLSISDNGRALNMKRMGKKGLAWQTLQAVPNYSTEN